MTGMALNLIAVSIALVAYLLGNRMEPTERDVAVITSLTIAVFIDVVLITGWAP